MCCARGLASGLIGVTSCIPVPNYDIEYVETALKRESSQKICESCPAAGWAEDLTRVEECSESGNESESEVKCKLHSREECSESESESGNASESERADMSGEQSANWTKELI